MLLKVMSKEKFNEFVDRLIAEDPAAVVGVKALDEKFVFGELGGAGDLRLDYDVTILPPKKYFLPARETIMTYDLTDGLKVAEVNEAEPLILIGVHPYDVAAIARMDKVFSDGNADGNYLKKREAAVIIGMTPVTVSPHAFAPSVGAHVVEDGFDLMLTDLGDKYAVEVGTPKGEELLGKYGAADDEDVDAKVAEIKGALPDKYEKKYNFTPEEGKEMLAKAMTNTEFWDQHAEKCLGCGSCVNSCPTCYCFDVQDDPHISLQKGERYRTWDGCMLEDFTKVAGGEVFRKTKGQRFQHRIYRKGVYLPQRFGFPGCVGCGRCASQCLPDIADPVKVLNDLKEVS
jgi:ferredoxin